MKTLSCRRIKHLLCFKLNTLLFAVAATALFMFALQVPALAQVTATQFTTIDKPGSAENTATGINDDGVIVGATATLAEENAYNDLEHGFIRSTKNKFTKIDAPNSFDTDLAGINQQGHVAGTAAALLTGAACGSQPSPCPGDDFVFLRKNGHYTTLCCFASGSSPDAGGINKRDEIVGNYQCSNSESCYNHGFLWRQGVLVNIDIGVNNTEASGINDAGVVVGQYEDSSFNDHGFVWYKGAFATLDVPATGTVDTDAYGISSDNDIVGGYQDASFNDHGFLLRKGVYYYPIDYPGASTTKLTGINDEGWVVGVYDISTETNRPSHAFRAKVSDPD
jgi:hypothetical protein